MSAKYKGEGFFIKNGPKAVLLIHGFTASTQEMEGLALALVDSGYTVSVPLLAGHNTNLAAFKKATVQSYEESIDKALDELGTYETVDVVGLSFGATLALHLAVCRGKVGKLVILSPAVFYYNPLIKLLPLLRFYPGKIMKKMEINLETGVKSRWDLFKPEAVAERIAYEWFTFPRLADTQRFMNLVSKEVTGLNNQILIIQSKKDTTTKPEGADFVFNKVASVNKKLIWLERSGHVITEDYEADIVTREVLNF
ncbi:MAG: alpha/beta fold hydrolase, partial [Candidatus Kerfeldbacteria bacterium]|nr:alpha/beta fold hydrolase [Candidatus Kerfeldbacteria bacterium]